jgi:O-methyltransferase
MNDAQRSRYIQRTPRFVRRVLARANATVQWLRKDSRYHQVSERRAMMRRAFTCLAFNRIEGDYAEFGCYGAMTFGLAHAESRKVSYPCRMWAFDSFQGLPAQSGPEDAHAVWVAGQMAMSENDFREQCATKGIPAADFRTVPGYYEDSLAEGRAGAEFPKRVAFAYIDCDLYSSTKTVLGFLQSRIAQGTILAFDDYYCYSTTAIAGERLAFAEFAAAQKQFHFLPYYRYATFGMSFIVEDKALWRERDGSVVE